ncbi:hypothetical protein BDZ89DRAFT_1033877 [Hymenopellis radicata]|nr:hypothetical protein BDZ89DRAFT_1033877 [Hymenopellis radicata]
MDNNNSNQVKWKLGGFAIETRIPGYVSFHDSSASSQDGCPDTAKGRRTAPADAADAFKTRFQSAWFRALEDEQNTSLISKTFGSACRAIGVLAQTKSRRASPVFRRKRRERKIRSIVETAYCCAAVGRSAMVITTYKITTIASTTGFDNVA